MHHGVTTRILRKILTTDACVYASMYMRMFLLVVLANEEQLFAIYVKYRVKELVEAFEEREKKIK